VSLPTGLYKLEPSLFNSTAGVIILKISHGYEVQEGHDPFVDLADQALQQFSASTAPGAFIVDLLPIRASH
jgi:hypothetical protein